MTYERLVPITASPEERDAILDDLAAFASEAKDAGLDPVCDIITTVDGDRWVIETDVVVPDAFARP